MRQPPFDLLARRVRLDRAGADVLRRRAGPRFPVVHDHRQRAAGDIETGDQDVALFGNGGDPVGGHGRETRQDGHVDAALVATLAVQDHRQVVVLLVVQHADQVLQHAPVLDLGQAEDVGPHGGDHFREMLDLGDVPLRRPARPAGGREVFGAGVVRIAVRVEQVLHVPTGDDEPVRRRRRAGGGSGGA